ncbi:poly [ADP-ribose] polymerase 1-like isoform X2 [Mizuhopecten yessoensis]|uniref:poly [ADP-ribose] polymerase 1-like isoform X2 n=1 Tax=Mizuhopecten yessoensis TaxID=6573 RepID=UPI000B45C059|nr:poly [ADP-ribose] polymerase 1-like isoform X2 [Mizuhopecten yessoensis]
MADGGRDLPFKSEYAKSGRSSCKACSLSISKDSLRLAIMVQSPMFDGKIPNWFHFACFWKRARVEDANHIHGFDALRWEDQEKIKEKVAGGGGGGGGGGDAGGATSGDYETEYAKSGRSGCRGCGDNIAKGAVRIAVKDFESQRAKLYGPQNLWYHVDCFVSEREDLEFTTDKNPDKIKGFNRLKKEDQEELFTKLGKGEKIKKRKGDAKGDAGGKKAKKEETEEEKQLREQSQLIWKNRDLLSKSVSNNAIKVMLQLNNQELPTGESRLLDACADALVFGALEKCPECKKGQLVYSAVGYKCSGDMTEWTKCMYITKTPKRKTFKIPKEYHDVPYLKSFKFQKRERLFNSAAVASSLEGSMDTMDSGAGPSSSTQSLEGMKFVITGKTAKPKEELAREITRLGGFVVDKVSSDVAACITTKKEVDKKSRTIKDAEKADIHVVDEGFLESVQKGGALLMIQSHSLATWGADPTLRVSLPSSSKSGGKKSSKSLGAYKAAAEKMYTKSVPKTMKMTVKGGAAVDPDSGLEDAAHTLEDKGNIYNAVLGMVDVVRGTNSFYKIQALEHDGGKKWWLFRSWGRVGTTIGSNKLEKFSSREAVINAMQSLYLEKTGNQWDDRKNFVKQANRFYPLDIDYGQEDEAVVTTLKAGGTRSKLPKPVQDLICMIFDVESMKKAMLEFEIDLKKMPLGKLSQKQIQSAYTVLSELTTLITTGGTQTQFLDATNRFYTLLPHDFGMKKPPLINSLEVIKAKTEMINNLLEIEVAYSMLKGGDTGEDPIDAHYRKLNTEIEHLDLASEESQRLLDYVKNTHAATHNQYDLEVLDIFQVIRDGEKSRYSPFTDLPNRQLLWHGSRTTNYAGILSQGLRIAPPEAPVTGYMFGKGVYFADMVSKSANYCRTSKNDPVGVLLLCEVALGNMYERYGADYIDKLPKGKHSCKGIGMTCPDPSGSYTLPDGSVIPMGKGVSSTQGRSSLLYNEFIVYDVAQINMKYLLKVNFKHKW